jgi:hypothetical protein
MRYALRALLIAIVVYCLAFAYRIHDRKLYTWLPGYVQNRSTNETARTKPVHLFFMYADHFEPGYRLDRMRRWELEYPKLAARHHDSTGRKVQHSWFYPGEWPIDENMRSLQRLVAGGNGEVELHYHHGNDTQESTAKKFTAAVKYFQEFNFLTGVDGKTHFAFIHGNWSLDNSNAPDSCGANREISLLRGLGCFADYTFPSIFHNSQPHLVNTIFQAVDDDLPKSYDHGTPLQTGRPVDENALVLVEGPLVLFPTLSPRKLFVGIEDGNVHLADPINERRVDRWVSANVHVSGQPDWVFIKIHGHGASSDEDMEETLGGGLDRGLSYLERRYNDGVNYVLHYVTAREVYNLVRAAAANKTGDPLQYMDWVIPPYEASRKPLLTPTAHSHQ